MPTISPQAFERFMAKRMPRRLPTREYGHLMAEPLAKRLEGHEEKTASDLADAVLLRCKYAAINQDELRELANDLQKQVQLYGPDSISQNNLRESLKPLTQDSSKQTLMGLGGGLAGGIAGSLGGAALSRTLWGKPHTRFGALMGLVPGTLSGYALGKQWQQRRELSDILREKL
jgi:hypothetical protein